MRYFIPILVVSLLVLGGGSYLIAKNRVEERKDAFNSSKKFEIIYQDKNGSIELVDHLGKYNVLVIPDTLHVHIKRSWWITLDGEEQMAWIDALIEQ